MIGLCCFTEVENYANIRDKNCTLTKAPMREEEDMDTYMDDR